jgi:hypothetical protein
VIRRGVLSTAAIAAEVVAAARDTERVAVARPAATGRPVEP